MKKQEAFKKAVESNNVNEATKLLKDEDVNPNAYSNWAILYSAKNGLYDMFCLLLNDSRINIYEKYDECVSFSALNNHPNILEKLLKIKINYSSAYVDSVCFAIKYNHIEILKLFNKYNKIDETEGAQYEKNILQTALKNNTEMLEFIVEETNITLKKNYSDIIQDAARFGNLNTLRLLIEKLGVKANYENNMPFAQAFHKKHTNILDYLLTHYDVKKTLQKDLPEVYAIIKKEIIKKNVDNF